MIRYPLTHQKGYIEDDEWYYPSEEMCYDEKWPVVITTFIKPQISVGLALDKIEDCPSPSSVTYIAVEYGYSHSCDDRHYYRLIGPTKIWKGL